MNYYYDVKLNFLNNYYKFYEWDESDKIITINKIPVYYIDDYFLNKVIGKSFTIDIPFLEPLINKTKLDGGVIRYSAIIVDYNSAYAFIFNEEGKTILYSSLHLEDELKLSEMIYTCKKTKLSYKLGDTLPVNNSLRVESIIKNFLKEEIKESIKTRNTHKLKYIYTELTNEIEEDYNKIITVLNNILKEKISKKVYNLYKIIKLSYNA